MGRERMRRDDEKISDEDERKREKGRGGPLISR